MALRVIDGWIEKSPNGVTLADLTRGREKEFPTIARAAKETAPAHDAVINWIFKKDGGVVSWWNYTQIFRAVWGEWSPLSKAETLTKFLREIEEVLEHGTRYRPNHPDPWPSFCGGYRFFLNSDLRDGDTLILRPLREPMLREITAPEDPSRSYEWICELSLEVIPEGV